MNSKLLLLLSLAAAMLAPGLRAGGLDVNISADIRLGRALPPPPPEVIVTERVGPAEPPPWAHPRWFHRSYDYYYYPECDVYYRPDRHLWFYLDGRTWRSAARLPEGLTIDFGRSVALKLDTDRPYTYHDRVVTYYPRNYFTRVKFKNERDDHHDDRDRHDDRGRDRHDDRDDHDHR